MTSVKKYEDFMRAHSVPKDAPKESIKTNARIPSKPGNKEQVYGGKYNIPDEKYEEFLNLYYKYCIDSGKDEFLTEIQREEQAPILVDIDLKYDHAINQRIHTKDHIDDLISLYLVTLKDIYQFNETPFYIFVMEKDAVNQIEDGEKSLTKDGIHLLIGIKASRAIQMHLRTKVLEKIAEMWKLPIVNTWDQVFDSSISSGNTGWQLFGSRKPDHTAYKLTHVYENKFDIADNEPMTNYIPLKSFKIAQKIQYLSARYTGFPEFQINPRFSALDNTSNPSGQKKRAYAGSSSNHFITNSGVLEAILYVKSHQELDLVVQETLNQMTARDYELVETHKYTMTLPEQYYGAGSYEKWLRVGMALSETCNLLFITWVAFSAQSVNFKFSDIQDMFEKWQKFDCKKGAVVLTRRSIMHWSKQDAPAKFRSVRGESVDYYIDKTIAPMMTDFNEGGKGNGKPCGDFDIANVLKQLYKDEYVCVSIKHNIWYNFKNHRWVEIDSGTTLRKAISTELNDIYASKLKGIETSINALESQDETNDLIKP